ncbi:beta-lactamase family protein [Venturia nashicola]|uniref:Beta-lactamase family protein n=1 Tax=Venturia nashicola TaxID=86259 RepID=A0A4Z1P8D7_9PEZI|nr:beta-lactamase family protein [Venturia nashicola]
MNTALPPETIIQLSTILQAASKNIPNLAATIVNQNGHVIFSHDDMESKETPIFWLASCIKLITAVATMQLVEQGKIDLADENIVERLCPELKELDVLNGVDEHGRTKCVKKEKAITVRMLLSHTAGFGYPGMSKPLRNALPEGYNITSGQIKDLCVPLLFQPGSDWQYGVNFDWLGIFIERLTNTTLNDYFQEHIFSPLLIEDYTPVLNSQQKIRLASLHHRNAESGKHTTIDQPKRHGQIHPEQRNVATIFGPPAEYTKLLSVLLNEETCPITKHQLLKPESVTQLLDVPIPQFTQRPRAILDGNPYETNQIPKICLPGREARPTNWCFAGAMEETTGKKPIIYWAGIANSYWWCDRERGVAGIVASQLLPFWNGEVRGVLGEILKVLDDDDDDDDAKR